MMWLKLVTDTRMRHTHAQPLARQVLNPERVSMPDFDFDIDFCLLDALNGWLKPENVEIVYQ